ncbi:MAG: BlaI/MecI/CopY family transcriptional regulator [Clostridia bacterium]|nr:BlaI/MecI/CopY family transcriptional regulator [Clostridia bacterium]
MIPQISDAEWQVMNVLWENSPLTANAIVHALQKNFKWKDMTIRTLIRRLVKKGALSYTVDPKDARIFYYRPTVSFEECIDQEKESLQKKANKKMGLLIASFIDDVSLTDREIDELSKILQEKRDKNG